MATEVSAEDNDVDDAGVAGGIASKKCMEIDSDIEMMPLDVFNLDMGEELKDEPGDGTEKDDDPERLPKESAPYPVLHPPEEGEASGRKAKVVEKIQQEAMVALQAGDVEKAVERYTEAMRINGSSALMLATRAALMLKLRRPCAAVRDCTAAIKINSMILKAYRVRGIAHRRLGHWRKAHRDLTQAQSLNFDADTAQVQKFVAAKLKKVEPKRKPEPAPAVQSMARVEVVVAPVQIEPPPPGFVMLDGMRFAVQPSAADKEFDQGQAVIAVNLMGARHLNGRRGVVQRRDPHPTRRGRWEVELRHEAGKVDVVALKAENIMVLNKADKLVCKAWMKEEKQHKAEVKKREEVEVIKRAELERADAMKAKAERERSEKEGGAKVNDTARTNDDGETVISTPPQTDADRVESKLAALDVQASVRDLLRQLQPDNALQILEKARGSGVSNLNAYLASQAKLVLGGSDSEDEADDCRGNGGVDEDDDPARIPEESQPFPPLVLPPADEEPPLLSDAQLQAVARAKKAAVDAAERGHVELAVDKYTEAICAGGATAMLLGKRAELLLRQRRPCAAIRDCSAAIEINPESAKAYRIRGSARRALGHWEDAQRDLGRAQKLDFDESIVAVQTFVALRVNALQERGPVRRRTSASGPGGEPPPKKGRV